MIQESFKNMLQLKTAEYFNFDPIYFNSEVFYGREEKNTPVLSLNKDKFELLTPELQEKFYKLCPRINTLDYTRIIDDEGYEKLITPREALIFVSEIILKPEQGEQVFGLAVANEIKKLKNPENIVISDAGFFQEAVPLIDLEGYKVVHVTLSSKGFGKEAKDELLTFKNDSRDYNLWDIEESIEYYFKKNEFNEDELNLYLLKLSEIKEILNNANATREDFKKIPTPIEKKILLKFLNNVEIISITNESKNLMDNLKVLNTIKEENKNYGKNVIFLLNGPAGSGKDFLANELIKIDQSNQELTSNNNVIKQYQELKNVLLECEKTKNNFEKLNKHIENLPVYISKTNKRTELYKDLIYISNRIIKNSSIKKSDLDCLNKLINKVSISLILSGGGQLFKNQYLFNSLNSVPYKNFNKDFFICNIVNQQPEIKKIIFKMFEENLNCLFKSGIITKLGNDYISYGSSISKEGLFRDLKLFQSILNDTKSFNINKELVLNKEAIEEYKEILLEDVTKENYFGYDNDIKNISLIKENINEIFNSLLIKEPSKQLTNKNIEYER